MARPEHHLQMLGLLEDAAQAAELFSRIADFMANICEHVGIEDAETVIAVVREKAQREARRQLATLISTQLQPSVLEALFAVPTAPTPEPRKRADSA
jgi:hypothetical protein